MNLKSKKKIIHGIWIVISIFAAISMVAYLLLPMVYIGGF